MNPYETNNHLAYGSDPTLSSTLTRHQTPPSHQPSPSPPIQPPSHIISTLTSNQDPLASSTSSTSSLENTNRLISDLERKLSIISSTSSNQTQQSQASSVIVNKSLSGIGKQNIQSAVLQYIKNNDNSPNDNTNGSSGDNFFNPNELYQERQVKLVTKFGNYYNDDKQRKVNQNNTGNRIIKLDDFNDMESQASTIDQEKELSHSHTISPNSEISNGDTNDNVVSTPNLHTVDTSIEGINVDDPIGIDTDESIEINHSKTLPQNDVNVEDEEEQQEEIIEEPIQQKQYGIFFNDDIDNDVQHDINVDEFDDENEEYEELLLPPSPPRSPPRDMDPNKLYGLYDFSGPDPSHLTLYRDEPVYLINDTDNYWWLVRKMSKEERIKYERLKSLNEEQDEYDATNEVEDGKIGFVPAECLETYGERLARLNCFKNEELEKSSKDNLSDLTVNNITNNDSTSSYGLGIINESGFFQSDESLSRSSNSNNPNNSSSGILSRGNSLLKRSGSKKSNKSVTFENLADLALDEEDDDDEESNRGKDSENSGEQFEGDVLNIKDTVEDEDLIREEKKKAGFDIDNYYDIPHNEIKKSFDDLPPQQEDEKRSEVLSDVYPSETPLIITKNSKKASPTIISSLTTNDKSINPQKPQPLHNLLQPPSKVNNYPSSNPYDTASIGSFSPDTPPTRFMRSNDSPSHQLTTPVDDKFDEIGLGSVSGGGGSNINEDEYTSPNLNLLRRSVILDRLTKVTSDIQDSLHEFDIEDIEEPHPAEQISTKEIIPSGTTETSMNQVITSSISSSTSSLPPSESVPELVEGTTEMTKNTNVYHSTPEPDTSFHTPQEVEANLSSYTSSTIPNDIPQNFNEAQAEDKRPEEENEDDDDDYEEDTKDEDDVGHREQDDITPLTSMNSLNYGISNILTTTPNKLTTLTSTNAVTTSSAITDVADKRKSRPVHDMFMPILGKFDELAEKLAELDDLL